MKSGVIIFLWFGLAIFISNSYAYDIGGAVEWEIGSWDITGVGMNIGENDDGYNYHFFAGQIGYAY